MTIERSYFLSVDNNLTIKNKSTMETFNFTLSPPLYYALKTSTYEMVERKIFCMYASAYYAISKEVGNWIFRQKSYF